MSFRFKNLPAELRNDIYFQIVNAKCRKCEDCLVNHVKTDLRFRAHLSQQIYQAHVELMLGEDSTSAERAGKFHASISLLRFFMDNLCLTKITVLSLT